MSQPKTYSAANAWATTTTADTEWDFKLPSGLVCRVRKPGMEEVMMSGMLDMMDSLGIETDNLMNPAEKRKQGLLASKGGHNPKGGAEQQEETGTSFMRQVRNDPLAFKRMMKMVDQIVVLTVVQPEVYAIPQKKNPAWSEGSADVLEYIDDKDAKIDGLVYTDVIDFGDKFAIMEVGMGDIEKMRSFREASDPVGAVQPGEGDDNETVLTTGDLV